MKTEIIERLLNAGGDPNDPDENGWTALHYAGKEGDNPEGITMNEKHVQPIASITRSGSFTRRCCRMPMTAGCRHCCAF